MEDKKNQNTNKIVKKNSEKKDIKKDIKKVKEDDLKNYYDKKGIIALIVFILTIIPIYCLNNNFVQNENSDKTKYKHLCLNKSVKKDSIVYKNMLKECTNEEELSKEDEIISKMNFDDEYEYSKEYYINDDKEENYILKPNDIYLKLAKNYSIKYLIEEGKEYSIDIKDKKVLATNLKDNSTKIIFDKEEIKYIILRNYNDNSSKLLLITIKNDIYSSNRDINNINDISFEKLAFKDITNIIINYNDDENNTETYAVDEIGNKYRID